MAETAVLDRWQGGWNPLNMPPDDLYPLEVADAEVVDAEGVVFTSSGEVRWGRNQFRIDSPTGTVKGLVEFVTDDYNQLLAFVDDGGTGKLYVLDDLDWSDVTPSQWTYGYELFSAKSWSEVTTESEAVDLLGGAVAAVVQVRNELFILVDGDTEGLVWDGETLRTVGIDAPSETNTISTSTGGGDLPSGTYSYYFTFYDPETGWESMPSPIADIHATGDGNSFTLSDITGDYQKKLYRAYTSDTGDDARGADFQHLTTLPAGSATASAEDLTAWTEVDTPGVLTVAANELEATNVDEDDEAYLYSDEGADNIVDFEYRFSFTVTSMDDEADVVLMGVSGDLDRAVNWTDGLGVRATRDTDYSGSSYQLFIDNYESAGLSICGIETEETYYVVFGRQGTNIYARVYTNSDYSGEPYAERTLKTNFDTTYQYVYLMNPYGTTTAKGTYQITDVVLEKATEFVDNVPAYALGPEIAFDHARPPYGTILHHHGDRLFMAGCTAGSPDYSEDPLDAGYYGNALFYTPLAEPTYWPGDNFAAVGDHSRIVALASWRSQLLIFKETSTWVLTGYAQEQFRLEQLEPNVGGLSAEAVASGPQGVLWAARDGLWFYDGSSINRVVPFGERSPWSADDVHSITYHVNRFYVRGPDDTLAVYHPERNAWTRMAWHDTDGDEDTVPLRTHNEGTDQAHIIARCAWDSSGDQEITVLHPVASIANHDGEGTSHSDLYAPVMLTLRLVGAPPGYEILPQAIWVVGAWDEHDTTSYRPKLYLNDDAGYSATAGDNAWETTPECPQGGDVIGVPNGYEYNSSARTNAARRWYVQIEGEWAKDFRLESVRVEYRLRTARGA